ncbi:MAG: hypothetical protein Kow0029_24920 [Candidatus Rifleibacteriota bacterium]
MKTLRKFAALFMVLTLIFATGCDAEKIMETITKVAEGISQAVPKIKEVIDTVSSAVDTATSTNTTSNDTEATNNTANVPINSAGDQENLNDNETNDTGTTTTTTTNNTTAQQAAIGNAIRNLVGSTSFRGPEVDGGNLACALVVSTALKNAGVLTRTHLNCDAVVADLRSKGWQRVDVPPYQEGDVVTWTTSRGPGRHIGIIVRDGSSYAAISNSSSLRTPRKHAINYMPITQVLRKV